MHTGTFYHLFALAVTLYGILIALVYTVWERQKRRPLRDGPAPSASVVVLSAGGLPEAGPTLEALAAQGFAGRLQVVVVTPDGERPAEGPEGLEVLAVSAVPAPVEDESGRPLTGRQRAWQAGVEASDGEVVLLLEPGAVPGPGWLGAMTAGLTADTHLVTGHVITDDAGRGPLVRVQQADALLLSAAAAGGIASGRPVASAGLNLGIRRSIWDALGGMPGAGRALSEESALAGGVVDGLGRLAVRAAPDPAATVRVPPAPELSGIAGMRRRWAAGTFGTGGLVGWLFRLSVPMAIMFWAGLVIAPFTSPFAPLPVLGPYVGLFFAMAIFGEAARSMTGAPADRGVLLPHMLFHLFWLAFIGPILALPLRPGRGLDVGGDEGA